MNVYWYISKAKLDGLEIGRKKRFWPTELELTLKEPFTSSEIKLGNAPPSKLADQVKTAEELYHSDTVRSYNELSGDVLPLFCRFSGVASRMIDGKAFWVALYSDEVALLLAGAASNAIGDHQIENGGISPSADPINAVRLAFEDRGHSLDWNDMSIERRLSYAWQVVWSTTRNALARPKVSGIAVLANIYAANKSEMRRARVSGVQRLVVGSPVFIRQAN